MKKKNPNHDDRILSNEEMMKVLILRGASDREILKTFAKRYARRGKKDREWVGERVAAYTRVAKRTPAVRKAWKLAHAS